MPEAAMPEAARFRAELENNILPFWIRHTVDREHGGFYGTIHSDLTVDKKAPRAAVINARILWTFSVAARVLGNPQYLEMADHAWDYIVNKFWDKQHGGVYWMLDYKGNPISDRKQIYAQAFTVYAMAEYFRASGRTESLDRAKLLFHLIEKYSRDPVFKGYLEACRRDWGALEDMRLSEKDLNSPKSMNTHLHVMEAYTTLLRVWRDPELAARQNDLLEVTMDRIVDGATGHFRLFFDKQWNSMSDHVSFGHDIEGSWLLFEAAEVLGDPVLLACARKVAVRMAEAVVGFYNAWQLSGQQRFLHAAERAWSYIEARIIDKEHGEWLAKLRPDGTPWKEEDDADACLVGPWKCPYHNSRVCFEMMERLG
ncbi:MAG: AGE family epimerase/isomerase [Bryobacteraceae bacterium]